MVPALDDQGGATRLFEVSRGRVAQKGDVSVRPAPFATRPRLSASR
jgi:hypothetical protein